MRKTIITLALALFVITAPIVAAEAVVLDDFEDGIDPTWASAGGGGLSEFTVTDVDPIEGEQSLYYDKSGDAHIQYEESHDRIRFKANISNYGGTTNDVAYRILESGGGDYAGIIVRDRNVIEVGGYTDTGVDMVEGHIYTVDINATEANDTWRLRIWNESTGNQLISERYSVGTAGTAGYFDIQADSTGSEFRFDYMTNGTIESGAETTETQLEIEIRKWMPFNSTQDYTVILNKTNTTTGETNLTDVTEHANVTSNDTSIVVANNTTDQLESFDVTGRTFVNATYQEHESNNTNVTVGPRNMTNIGIMPPEEWTTSFFEIDDTTGGHGIGSDMQWIWFIIIVMTAAAQMTHNPWAGLGAGLLVSILLWVLSYVSLGVVLSTVFGALMLGLVVARTRRSVSAAKG